MQAREDVEPMKAWLVVVPLLLVAFLPGVSLLPVPAAPWSELSVPAGAREIDVRGMYLIPGLADAHVHPDSFDELVEADDSPYRDSWHWSKLYLAMPVDTGAFPDAAEAAARAGLWTVPTLVQAEKVASPEQMREWLESPSMAYVPPDLRHVWAPENRDPFTRELLEGFGEEEQRILARGRRNRLRLVRALHDAGARLLAGSDTPNPFVVPGSSLHEELALFVEAGISPADALAVATREAAHFLGTLEQAGMIEEGKVADLVLLRRNPLEDVGATRSIAGVMLRGGWLPEDRIAELLREVANAYERR